MSSWPANRLLYACAVFATIAGGPAFALPPHYDHVVVVIVENVDYDQIINSPSAPYINSLRAQGANIENLYAFHHTSAPNYGELFAGHDNGIGDFAIPAGVPFITPNFGASLRHAGSSFTGYAQSLPEPGSTVFTSGDYARRHNPYVNWQNDAADAHPNQLPSSVNLPFSYFPDDFSQLPAVSFVIPDNAHNMHDGATPARITVGDTWIRDNLDAYYQWAKAHNSLLIITADEDHFNLNNNFNNIPTIVAGAHVRPNSTVSESLTLHNILRTLEDTYGTAHSGSAANVRAITGPFISDPTTSTISFRNGQGGYNGARDTQLRQDQPNTTFAALEKISVSLDDNAAGGKQPTQMLIRFDDVIGTSAAQVPAGATVTSAKLILWTNSASSSASDDPVSLHRMLSDWSEASTWNTLTGGISPDGAEADVAPDFSHEFGTLEHPQFFDVSNTFQAYADGRAPNFGWAVLATGTDGYTFNSSDALTPPAQRPSLEITYALLPRWKSIVPGSWGDADNWSFGLPDGVGATARISLESPLDIPFVGITLDGDRTVGNLAFAASTSYRLLPGAGGGVLHFNNGGIAPAHVHVTTGDHTIEAQSQFDDHARIETDAATSLTFAGGVVVAAGKTFTKIGEGTVIASRVLAGSLTVNAGSMVMAPNGGDTGTSVLGSLSIAGDATPTARLDITNNAAIVDYPAAGPSPAATIRGQIIAGRGGSGLGKSWNGLGITSSTTQNDVVTSPNSTSVAYAVNGDLPLGAYTNFRGQPVDPTSVLIRYTRTADANLDGVVDDNDVTIVGGNYAPGISKPSWALGDFDYNGFVDDDDVTLLGAFYNPSAAPLAATVSDDTTIVAVVPEPSTVVLLIALLLAFLVLPLGRS